MIKRNGEGNGKWAGQSAECRQRGCFIIPGRLRNGGQQTGDECGWNEMVEHAQSGRMGE